MSIDVEYDRLNTALEFDTIRMTWEEAPAPNGAVFVSKYRTISNENVIISVNLSDGMAWVEATRWRRHFVRVSVPFNETSTVENILLGCLNTVVNGIDSRVIFIYPHASVKLTDECFTEPLF